MLTKRTNFNLNPKITLIANYIFVSLVSILLQKSYHIDVPNRFKVQIVFVKTLNDFSVANGFRPITTISFLENFYVLTLENKFFIP